MKKKPVNQATLEVISSIGCCDKRSKITTKKVINYVENRLCSFFIFFKDIVVAAVL